MNIIDLQERLKDLPENALMQEMQAPTGTAPQFLVLSELKRRKRIRDDYQRQQAQGMQTVAEEAITAAGMPQEGIMGLAQGMAPRSAIAQDTGVNDMMRQDSVRAPQPEQPMMMAGGGVLKMQPGGFTDRQQQGYLIFLEQMSLQDSPQSREMYTRMMERQAASPPGPEFYMRGMDEAPQGIASINADVSSFLPSGPDDGTRAMVGMPRAVSRPTMMTAPPVLGAVPTADAIDFDASVFETAPASPFHEQSGLEYGEMTPQELSILANGGDPIATEIINKQYNDSLTTQPLDDGNRAGQQPNEMEAERELREINARLQDPDLSETDRGYLENRKSVLEFQFKVAESPSYLMELIDRGAANLRGAVDPYIASILSRVDPEAAMDYDAYSKAVISGFKRRADESAEEYDARMKALGIGDEGISAAVPSTVEDQGLSFGLGGMDIPGSGTSLSFGDVTPSAADITLSMGEPVTDEPIPEFSLGEPVRDPAAPPPARNTGGSGAGGFGPIESRIARMLEEREKSAEADKWLALAQTGLALMASDQPTLGGAIGEAGLAGIGAMQQARSQYDKDIMGLLDMQAGVQRARAAGAKSERDTVSGTERVAYFKAANDATIEAARLERQLTIGGEIGELGEVRPYTAEEKVLLNRQLNEARSRANVFSGLSNPALATIQALNE